MTLPREEVVKGLVDEIDEFGTLVASLSDDELAKPSRCEGWTVGDVAAHVTGQLADIVHGRFDGLGTPEVTQRQVDERRGRTGVELAAELKEANAIGKTIVESIDDAAWAGPAPGPVQTTMGEGVEGLWYDAYVHAEDIRSATGRPSERGPGLRASVAHLADLLTQRGYGPATLALDGLEAFPVSGGVEAGAGGKTIEGDPLDFVLVATGRRDPATLGLDDKVNVYAP
ncbi:MAG TPA: maleylpyruvate isomerase family mycothiol-dependent enzyme [Acidimicrobiales bacterium]